MCIKLIRYQPECLFHDKSASITYNVYNLFKTIVNSILSLNSSYLFVTRYRQQKTFESKGKKVDCTMIVSKRTICFIHITSNESNSKENILCLSFILNKTSNWNDNPLDIVETIEYYYDLSFTNTTTRQYSKSLLYIGNILGDLNKSNTMMEFYNSTITQLFNTKSYSYNDKFTIASKNYDMNFKFIRSMTSLIFDNDIYEIHKMIINDKFINDVQHIKHDLLDLVHSKYTSNIYRGSNNNEDINIYNGNERTAINTYGVWSYIFTNNFK